MIGAKCDLPQNYVRVRRCMFEQSGRYYCTVGLAVRVVVVVVVGLSSSLRFWCH